MQAITTKYIGPSNTRGSRIKAETAQGETLTIDCAGSISEEENHISAARSLAERLNWHGSFVGDRIKGARMVFVWDNDDYRFTI
jgi:hypothetical protein